VKLDPAALAGARHTLSFRRRYDSSGDGPDSSYGWAIVAALSVTVTVSYGVLIYAFGVLLVPMQRDLGWSRLELTGAFSLALAVSALAGIVVGVVLDHHSPRGLMSVGSALAALLVLGWARITNLAELYLVFAGLGIAMAGVLYGPAFVVVTKWFHVRRRAALTTVTLAGAFASFIFSPLTEKLATVLGWRDALLVLAAILGGITIPLHAVFLRPAPLSSERHPAEPAPSARAVLRARHFWLLTLSFALGSFTWSAIVVHLVAFLLSQGRSAAFAAFAIGTVGMAQLPGRVLFALLGRYLYGRRLPLAAYGLAAVSLSVLALDRSQPAVLLFAAAFGMSAGMQTLLGATLPAELYGRRIYGAVSGVVYACSNGARAVAPFAAAAVALLPGHYTTLLWLLVSFSVLAALFGAVATQEPRHALVEAAP
jgi:MFS family permease